MVSVQHNSRLLAFRRPQGAVPSETTVRLEAALSGGLDASVTLRLWYEDGREQLLPMTVENGRAWAEVTMPGEPGLVWYYFIVHDGGETGYYGAASGEGRMSAGEPQSYQITVYDGAFRTPRRVCEGVAYQIFPDRFKRSSWEDFRSRAQYHAEKGRFLRIHDRWSENVCSTPSPGQDVYMPDDFFGGDLNGIREKLPYLADLGVTLLYLNPVFESASNHRYDTADYHRIDPILGTEEEFRALCREAAERGIAIILDGVFSHTGADSRYFDRYHRYDDVGAAEGKDSPYGPWYNFFDYPETYDCWWDFPALPNVTETEPSYTEFIAGERGVLAHWLRNGAAGWRLDVADELPDAFIRTLRSRIKAVDPEAYLLGEVWEDCSNKYGPEGRRGYVTGDELDGAMNYPFTDAVIAFFTGKLDAYGLNERLATLREHYPKPFYEACFNLLSSHDVVRAATALSGAPDRRATSRAQQANYAPSPENALRGRQRLILATALQMALPGVPCVYYGDEAGMTGMADPFNRGTYPWGNEDAALVEIFKKLIRARRETPALRAGLLRMGALSPEVFAVVRYTEDGTGLAVLAINRSEQTQRVRLAPETLFEGPDADKPVPAGLALSELFTGAHMPAARDMTLVLPPLGARFYIGS